MNCDHKLVVICYNGLVILTGKLLEIPEKRRKRALKLQFSVLTSCMHCMMLNWFQKNKLKMYFLNIFFNVFQA